MNGFSGVLGKGTNVDVTMAPFLFIYFFNVFCYFGVLYTGILYNIIYIYNIINITITSQHNDMY